MAAMFNTPAPEESVSSDIRYHFVWVTRRRRQFLIGPILSRVVELLTEAADTLGVRVVEVGSGTDYLVVTVDSTTDLAPAMIVSRLKRHSASGLRRQFPDLARLPSIWTRQYLATTRDELNQDRVERFVRAQPRNERRRISAFVPRDGDPGTAGPFVETRQLPEIA
jgi:REP-associated tyrosine transposase